ncbi:hypothetical protein [Micromonospora costi]|uniref:hypothetical protein n=1 Tax=Micromonospora costi TaxID=1530042 RepID=UPI00131A40E8|nr:hypothetical protein [Micromonospora costi]
MREPEGPYRPRHAQLEGERAVFGGAAQHVVDAPDPRAATRHGRHGVVVADGHRDVAAAATLAATVT